MSDKKHNQEDLDELFAVFDKKYNEFEQKYTNIEHNIKKYSEENDDEPGHNDHEIQIFFVFHSKYCIFY